MVYIIKSALLLIALYGCFALLLSRETFHRLNRICLLSILVASMVLPVVEIRMNLPWVNSNSKIQEFVLPVETHVENSDEGMVANELSVPMNNAQQTTEELQVVPAISPISLLWVLYIVGFVASLIYFLWQIIQLRKSLRNGVRTRDEVGNTIIVHGGNFPPHSFLHYIIISARDYDSLRQPILAHEQAHIRLGHTWDILFLRIVQVFQWFNPFVYLLGRDLRAVHEYEADNAVLNQGIDAKTYQLLLVTKAVGNRLQTLTNSLNHGSLKKRIMMMHKMNSNQWRMARVAVLPVMMGLAVVAFAKPKVEEIILTNETDLAVVEDNHQVQDNKPVTVAVPGMGLVMTDEVKGFSDKKMLNAFIPKEDAKDFITKHGPAISVFWLKGTWVEKDDGSYIEEHPDCRYAWAFHTKYYKVMLDGKQLDVNNLPDLPASALKKVEIHFKDGNGTVNLITKPVQIPADVKGNINPELTILLTGTPPKDSGAKTTIWERRGNFDGFSWKNYTICSWKWDVDDISVHLKEVAIRKDHNVRINVCKGVPQKHIDRIKSIMQECGVTNYRFVKQ